jgi:hypothetical protein
MSSAARDVGFRSAAWPNMDGSSGDNVRRANVARCGSARLVAGLQCKEAQGNKPCSSKWFHNGLRSSAIRTDIVVELRLSAIVFGRWPHLVTFLRGEDPTARTSRCRHSNDGGQLAWRKAVVPGIAGAPDLENKVCHTRSSPSRFDQLVGNGEQRATFRNSFCRPLLVPSAF